MFQDASPGAADLRHVDRAQVSEQIRPFYDFDIEGACAYMGVKKAFVYAHIRRINHYKLANRLLFLRKDLDKFVEVHLVAPKTSRG